MKKTNIERKIAKMTKDEEKELGLRWTWEHERKDKEAGKRWIIRNEHIADNYQMSIMNIIPHYMKAARIVKKEQKKSSSAQTYFPLQIFVFPDICEKFSLYNTTLAHNLQLLSRNMTIIEHAT